MSTLNTVQKFFPKVTSVVDATSNVVIEVTKSDASSKAVKNHNACAMTVACKRKFKLDGVIISRTLAYLIKGKQARRFLLPESVKKEIVSFDRGAGFEIGKYELSKIPVSMTKPRLSNRDRGNRGTKLKRSHHVTTNVRHVLGGQKPEDE